MSTLATQPILDLDWKQEVNKRLAAHKIRRVGGLTGRVPSGLAPGDTNSRAAQAAARVAARYAQAPSYSQMLAEEARTAARPFEAVSQAGLMVQPAVEPVPTHAEPVLAEFESSERIASVSAPAHPVALEEEPLRAFDTFFDPFLGLERPVAPRAAAPALEIRWEPDLPVRPAEPAVARASYRSEQFAFMQEDWSGPATAFGEPETVEPAQPIHACLIEFPRELIAPRKARPRIAEGPLAPEDGAPGQLSIFEVASGSISILPEPAHAGAEPAASGWSRLRLEAERLPDPAGEETAAPRANPIHLAPVGVRMLAAVIDCTLIGAAFVGLALVVAANLSSQPSLKIMEFAACAALLAVGVLYQELFFLLAGGTPGMHYAGLALCTFEDQKPTRKQMRRRIGALMLSLLPAGLGILWAIFDEDHLSWHDRISRTYQRCA